MKTLIIYSSQTGNTKKLAEALYRAVDGEKHICPIEEAPDSEKFDLVVLGFWLMAGKPDPKSSDFLVKLGSVDLFLFATHGAASDSPHALNGMALAESLVSEANIVGRFNCSGEVNPAFLEKAKQKDPQPPWIDDAPASVGHPDPNDIRQLIEAVRAVLPA